MPVKRKSNRKTYKASSSKKRKTSSSRYTNRVPNSLSAVRIPGKNVMPQLLMTQFQSNSRLNLTYTGSTLTSTTASFQANSLFDPLGNSGTIQPQFFDEMMAFYQRFQVIKCKLELGISNTTDACVLVNIVPITDLTDTYTLDTASVMPRAITRTLGPLSGSNSTIKMKSVTLIKNVAGTIDDTILQGTSTSSPTRLVYWHVSHAPTFVGLSSDYTINLWVKLTFYTLLSDCQVLVAS